MRRVTVRTTRLARLTEVWTMLIADEGAPRDLAQAVLQYRQWEAENEDVEWSEENAPYVVEVLKVESS